MLYILFRQIAAVSLSGVLLILTAMLTMQLWGKHAKAATRSLVWTLLFLRLCIPADHLLPTLLTVEVPAFAQTVEMQEMPLETMAVQEAVPVLAETVETEERLTTSMAEEPDRQEWEFSMLQPEADSLPITSVKEAVEPAQVVRMLVPMLWLMVAIGLFAGRLWAYNYQVRSLFHTAQLLTQEDCHIWQEVCAELLGTGKACGCRLIRSPLAGSPMMCGYFCPTVVLPDLELEPDALRGILTHELAHYRRRDIWRKLLCLAVRSLHWFNPLVYAASLRWMNDMEMACDDQVLEDLDEVKRREYGEMMLDMLRRCHKRQETLTTGFSPRKSAMLARFRNIMDTTKKSRARVLPALMAAACLLSGAVTATAPGQDEGILAAVRFGDDRAKKHTSRKASGKAADTNVVYTGKTVDFEDPNGQWEGWYHAELPYIQGEDEWNARMLADFETRYGDDIAQLQAGESPYMGTFRIGYETVKWQDTVTIVMRYRSLSLVRHSEDDPGELVDRGGVSHKIYHYNTKTKEFLTTDQFLEIYTDGKWTSSKLLDMALNYGFCRNGWGNPRFVQESDFLGVIPSYQGNGQFDACFSFGWADSYEVGEKSHSNILVRILDYEPYLTTGHTWTDEAGEVRTVPAGERLCALVYRPSTDQRYRVQVYHQTAMQVEVQQFLLDSTPKGAAWRDTYEGPMGIYTLSDTLSPHTVDPKLTFVEKEGSVQLEVTFPGSELSRKTLLCQSDCRYAWTWTEPDGIFSVDGEIPVMITSGGVKGLLRDWAVYGLPILIDKYRAGQLQDGWEPWPKDLAIPTSAPVADFWNWLKRLESADTGGWEALVPLSEKVVMKVTYEIGWKKPYTLRVDKVAFVSMEDVVPVG